MSVNGVTESSNAYSNYNTSSKKTSSKDNSSNSSAASGTSAYSSETAAVYESSSQSSTISASNAALIAQLKQDSNNRMAQMQSLVEKMFAKQGITIGSADDMWKALAGGNFTADADTIAQAKQDISEDGYWGVSQTSERIFSFAMALSGGDETQMEKMKEAVEKGFKEATKSWGSTLPSISSDTYDSVMSKFDDWFSANTTATE